MERSIETIWKEGFLKSDPLIVPKINDLYNKKSIHIIEKFERMFTRNIWGIVAFSTAIFIGSLFIGAAVAGSLVYAVMLYVAYTAHRELQNLRAIDKGQNSYAFLRSFKNWIERMVDRYGSMYRFVYPFVMLAFYFGIWFSDAFSVMRETVKANTNDMIFGMHTYSTLLIVVFALLMSIFSKRINRADVQVIYGRVLRNLDSALREMEALQEEK